jgi:streptogramin lyase
MALPVAEAASGLGMLKHYRLPTSTDPHDVTTATDGNVWFTVQGAFDPVTFFTPGSVARVTPRGDITEFAVCDGCILNDIVQGPDGILYISDNDGQLRRITTSGEVLSSISVCGEVFCDPLGGPDQHLVRGFLQQPGRSFQRLRRSG